MRMRGLLGCENSQITRRPPGFSTRYISPRATSGSAIAQAASGLVLASDKLDELANARTIARRMRVVLAQNLDWALAYNLCAVPLAAFGLVPPWLAAIGMSASSLVVILNSLRIDAPRMQPTASADVPRLLEARA